MKTHRFPLFAAAAALSLVTAAPATVLVYEGFHPSDYNNVGAGSNVAAGDTTFTPGNTIGVASGTWVKMGGTRIRVFGVNYGLALPSAMTAAGFTAIGGTIGLYDTDNNSDMRAMFHNFTTDTLKVSSGSLYVRMLLNLDATAAAKLAAGETLSNKSGGYFRSESVV